MNIRTIIQARLGSSRLPNKVVKPLVEWLDSIDMLAMRLKEPVFCISETERTEREWIFNNDNYYFGSEQDVLARYHQSIAYYDLDHIIRVTNDCPLMTQRIIDKLTEKHLDEGNDFTYYTGSIHGLACEAFTREALEISHSKSTKKEHREHVSDYIIETNTMKIGKLTDRELGLITYGKEYRLTLDYPEDLTLLRGIFQELWRPHWQTFTVQEVLDLLQRKPWMMEINERWKI